MTPQEIHLAWQAGATMVKIFPSKFFGPDYFKEIKRPFSTVRLLACGGITPENLGTYKKCGADGFAVGGSIFSKSRLDQDDFTAIGENLKQYLAAYKAAAA
ncbi:bifunctional 4-hydroxy-2-oxoglutarate aldolase/2-dehydro-3-deoxy-phosphogluconate aldolase [bacterium]|nr:bifunctional 4-hydroxy-2-oxoglutarate aldolase/2-dehydro-3-deoxy-phosphogluconate aldolase [bacterium]